MWCCLFDPTFSRFSRTPTCVRHRQTDRRTRAHDLYRACIASRGKNRFQTTRLSRGASPSTPARHLIATFRLVRRPFRLVRPRARRFRESRRHGISFSNAVVADADIDVWLERKDDAANRHNERCQSRAKRRKIGRSCTPYDKFMPPSVTIGGGDCSIKILGVWPKAICYSALHAYMWDTSYSIVPSGSTAPCGLGGVVE